MFNKVILIGRLGQNAEAKTAQNNKEYVILNIATQESWKNDKGDYESYRDGFLNIANLPRVIVRRRRYLQRLWYAAGVHGEHGILRL